MIKACGKVGGVSVKKCIECGNEECFRLFREQNQLWGITDEESLREIEEIERISEQRNRNLNERFAMYLRESEKRQQLRKQKKHISLF